MKICILTAKLEHGGASIVALDVAKGIAEKGHEVLFVCSGKEEKNFEHEGFRIKELRSRIQNPLFHYFNPFLIFSLHRVLREFHPDIIHIHNINLQTFSLCALLFSHRYPMVWTLHDLWPVCLTGWPDSYNRNCVTNQCQGCPNWPQVYVKINKFLKEYIYQRSKFAVVCPSRWMTEQLQGSVLSKKDVYIVHNGVDINVRNDMIPADELKSQLKITDGSFILLFIGGKRLAGLVPAKRKGWSHLVSALRQLNLNIFNNLHLIYVGDPIDLPEDFPLPVTFIHNIPRRDMPSYYHLADIFILPTLADNFPLTIIEAMASHTPVIATDVGGIPEIVFDHQTGIVICPQDDWALKNAIEELWTKSEVRNNLAKQAFELINEKFSFDKMIDGYETIYHEVIKKFIISCDPSWSKHKGI